MMIFLFLFVSIGRISIVSCLASYLGFDFGTSGARSCIVDKNNNIIFENSMSWSEVKNDFLHNDWLQALRFLIGRTEKDLINDVRNICISGTSSTSVIIDFEKSESDEHIFVTRPARMYDYNVVQNDGIVGEDTMKLLGKWCSKDNAAYAPTSALVSLLINIQSKKNILE